MKLLINSSRATSSYISDSQRRRLRDIEEEYGIAIVSIEHGDDAHETVIDLDLDLTMLDDIYRTQSQPSMQTLNAFTYSLIKTLEDDASERL